MYSDDRTLYQASLSSRLMEEMFGLLPSQTEDERAWHDACASSARQRDEAVVALLRGASNAIELARGVQLPDYRAQALAYASRLATEMEQVRALGQESIDVALQSEDLHRRVSVMAWSLSAMLDHGHVDLAVRMAETALDASEAIYHPVRRMDALFDVWMACLPDFERFLGVHSAVLEACHQANSWRSSWRMRIMVETLLYVGRVEEAHHVVGRIGHLKQRRKAERIIAQGREVRPFCFFRECAR